MKLIESIMIAIILNDKSSVRMHALEVVFCCSSVVSSSVVSPCSVVVVLIAVVVVVVGFPVVDTS